MNVIPVIKIVVKIEGSRTEATIEPFVCKLAVSADKVDFSEVVLKSILDK